MLASTEPLSIKFSNVAKVLKEMQKLSVIFENTKYYNAELSREIFHEVKHFLIWCTKLMKN